MECPTCGNISNNYEPGDPGGEGQPKLVATWYCENDTCPVDSFNENTPHKPRTFNELADTLTDNLAGASPEVREAYDEFLAVAHDYRMNLQRCRRQIMLFQQAYTLDGKPFVPCKAKGDLILGWWFKDGAERVPFIADMTDLKVVND